MQRFQDGKNCSEPRCIKLNKSNFVLLSQVPWGWFVADIKGIEEKKKFQLEMTGIILDAGGAITCLLPDFRLMR